MSTQICAVFSISNPYNNHTKRSNLSNVGKRGLYVYGIDKDGKFCRKRINRLQIPFYNRLKVHRKLVTCTFCGGRFQAIYKEKSELESLICPECNQ